MSFDKSQNLLLRDIKIADILHVTLPLAGRILNELEMMKSKEPEAFCGLNLVRRILRNVSDAANCLPY